MLRPNTKKDFMGEQKLQQKVKRSTGVLSNQVQFERNLNPDLIVNFVVQMVIDSKRDIFVGLSIQ